MPTSHQRQLAAGLLRPVQAAGRRILAFAAQGTRVELKADRSPVTEADRAAEEILVAALARLAPDVPIVAEEAMAAGGTLQPGTQFFLVDPLDGTREFVAGHTDFTVNVALVRDGAPVFGMVHAPALATVWMTLGPTEAVRAPLDPHARETRLDRLETVRLETRLPPVGGLAVTVSRSHLDAETKRLLARYKIAETVPAGSSLKFCRLAEGVADLYPRLSRTMEWDTGAGDAILRAAGGAALDLEGHPLLYGKHAQGFANPGFVAWGRVPAEVP